ncbi:MAG: CoA pyrophosphatase [Spirochaetales bacterium]|nr:CoA pyrophosphatase [Spirochaetales bacterium]
MNDDRAYSIAMMLHEALSALRGASHLPGEAAHMGMLPEYRRNPPPHQSLCVWRDAAVLVLLYEDNSQVRFPLMLRTDGMGVHAGQVSLPGGSREGAESYEACALRETGEELGVDLATNSVVAALSPLRVPPSRFIVYPFVGTAPGLPRFAPSADEVAALFTASLDELLDPKARFVEDALFEERLWSVPYYKLAGQRVWGATAMILAELAAVLRG